MGAICGVLYFDGLHADNEPFSHLTSSLNHLGPDGTFKWTDGPVGLALQKSITTPESKWENKPVRIHHTVVTAVARIDNRQELLNRFKVPASEHPLATDSWLIQKSYLEWGENCCSHLVGDFCFAVWDERKQRLFLARDHFGTRQIFFYRTKKCLVFSSSLAGLLSWPEFEIQLNPLAIAATLVSAPTQDFTNTPYKNVNLIPPAHYLVVAEGREHLCKYWSVDDIPEIRFSEDQEYVEAFNDRFSEAVNCRMRTVKPVGLMLSGGLDSGSVAVEAGAQVTHLSQALQAFTSVPGHGASTVVGAKEYGDESLLARATAEKAGNIHSHSISGQHKSTLTAIDQALSIYRHPQFSASNCHWILSIYEEMKAHDMGTVLVGQYGNATISWTGNRSNYLRSLMRGGYWREYSHEFAAFRNALDLTLFSSLKSFLIAPSIPPGWLTRLYKMGAGKEPWQMYSAINPAFASSLKLRSMLAANNVFGKHRHNPDFRKYFLHFGHYSINATASSLADHFGLDRRDPTADKRLIEFCFGIPESQYVSNGEEKRLIHRAMKGKLPDQVLFNPLRGTQSVDTVWRIRNSSDEISTALDEVSGSELAREYLDVDRMKAVYEKTLATETLKTRFESQNILLGGLKTARFLRTFE